MTKPAILEGYTSKPKNEDGEPFSPPSHVVCDINILPGMTTKSLLHNAKGFPSVSGQLQSIKEERPTSRQEQKTLWIMCLKEEPWVSVLDLLYVPLPNSK